MYDLSTDLKAALTEYRIDFISIIPPRDGSNQWRVNFRAGPGWSYGQPASTFEEAFSGALGSFRDAWGDKMLAYAKNVKSQPVESRPDTKQQALTDLLG